MDLFNHKEALTQTIGGNEARVQYFGNRGQTNPGRVIYSNDNFSVATLTDGGTVTVLDSQT